MTNFLEILGTVTAICGGGVLVLLFVLALTAASSHVMRLLLDHYGGWKTFLEYRKWYQEKKYQESKHESRTNN